jgi:hypothetical protein
MAVCGKLTTDLDFGCPEFVRQYEQSFVILNASDIDTETVDITKANDDATTTANECRHRVEFSLKAGAKGYRVSLPETGNTVFGSYDMARNEAFGTPQYIHKVNFAGIGVQEAMKCALRELGKGNYVVALKPKGQEIVEIFGITNGLELAGYTYDIVAGSGGSVLILNSKEVAPENDLPYILGGTDPIATYDANFQ